MIEKETGKSRQFAVGDPVLYWNVHYKTWNKGTIKELQGSKVFLIQSETGETRKHLDHIVKATAADRQPSVIEKPGTVTPQEASSAVDRGSTVAIEHDRPASLGQNDNIDKGSVPPPQSCKIDDNRAVAQPRPVVELPQRSSTRTRQAPDRLVYHKFGGP